MVTLKQDTPPDVTRESRRGEAVRLLDTALQCDDTAPLLKLLDLNILDKESVTAAFFRAAVMGRRQKHVAELLVHGADVFARVDSEKHLPDGSLGKTLNAREIAELLAHDADVGAKFDSKKHLPDGSRKKTVNAREMRCVGDSDDMSTRDVIAAFESAAIHAAAKEISGKTDEISAAVAAVAAMLCETRAAVADTVSRLSVLEAVACRQMLDSVAERIGYRPDEASLDMLASAAQGGDCHDIAAALSLSPRGKPVSRPDPAKLLLAVEGLDAMEDAGFHPSFVSAKRKPG